MSNNSRIAKNTIFLYVRMFLLMGVTLYTSRIVLQQLGVSDYGIYILVGGIVTSLGFFNAAMTAATQRYLAFDIGKKDFSKVNKTFSTSLIIHFSLAIIVVILAETIGVWYINNKMIFSPERVVAVNIVYQFSLLTFVLNIIQVPYNALILAKERMNIYAYISVFEVVLKLIGASLLIFVESDKLILYSIIVFIISLIIRTFYQIYCRRKFAESKFKYIIDKVYMYEMIGYSGWNLFGNIAAVARNQGNSIVLNLFFGTVVNAAFGITLQVQTAIQQFVNNFQAAVNPQIIKQYAIGEIKKVHNLIFTASKMSFFLLVVIIYPIWSHLDFLLNIWLTVIPENSVNFIKLTLIYLLVDSISYPLITAVQATGKVKNYQVILGSFIFLSLPISYTFLKLGFPATSIFIILIIITVISLIIRMFFIKNLLKLQPLTYLIKVLFPIFLVSIFLIGFSVLIDDFFVITNDNFVHNFISAGFYFIICLLIIYLMGLSSYEKIFIKSNLKKIFK